MNQEHKIDFFPIKINGDDWNIYKVHEIEEVALDESSAAEIDFTRKEITFKEYDIGTVRHEVFHIFVGYTYTRSANLSAEQMEEICCTIYEDKKDILDNLSDTIYRKLKDL